VRDRCSFVVGGRGAGAQDVDGGTASDDSDSDEEGSSGSASGDDESSDTDNEGERQARRRKRQRSTGAASSMTATPGLGQSVDELFAATDTAILSSTATAFVAPSLDVAANEAKARAAAAVKAQAAAKAAEFTGVSAKLDVPNAKFLRDIPGDPASKHATAKDWKSKEKLKRDRGQVSRFKNYVEEEKRLLREYEGNATAQS
jgi:hypothetical protein